jgi:hypothetical protein
MHWLRRSDLPETLRRGRTYGSSPVPDGQFFRFHWIDWVSMEFLRRTVVAATAMALVCGLGLSGCGTPAAPQPPSLKLPEPVTDLSAVRAGNVVTLHWTMPRKTTDHLLLTSQIRGPIPVRVCRREKALAECQPVGEAAFAPGVDGEFHETLPGAFTTGEPRQLIYFVELRNKVGKAGRSAGLSNSATVAAGTTPVPVTGLRAEARADGVALHWNNDRADKPYLVRLHRRLVSAPIAKPKKETALGNAPIEPPLQDLLVDAAPAGHAGGAVDKSARFGEIYEYTAQRLERVTVDGKALELAGDVSAPIQVDVADTFPPAVPTGLVAVVVAEEKTIDLSWQPNVEEDLAGYIVYRAEPNGDWKRISPIGPLSGPAYRDATVETGRGYRYAVSAIDLTGHESKRSAEAQESVPEPEK